MNNAPNLLRAPLPLSAPAHYDKEGVREANEAEAGWP